MMEWDLIENGIVLDIFFNVLSMMVTVAFCDGFMERRAAPRRFFLLVSFNVIGNTLLLNLLGASMGTVGNIIIPLLAALPMVFYGYSCTPWQAVFFDAAGYAFLCMMDYITQITFSAISGYSVAVLRARVESYLLMGLAARSVEIALAHILGKLRRKGTRQFALPWPYWLGMLLGPALIFMFYRFFVEESVTQASPDAFIAWAGIALILVQLLLLWQMEHIHAERQKQEQIKALQKEAELRIESTTQLAAAYETQRKASHDYTNHLAVLQELLRNKKIEDAQHYLCELSDANNTMLVVSTADPVVDAVLNQKYVQAKERGVLIRFKVNDITSLCIERKDLVTVLANLLNNALEASEKAAGEKIVVFKLLKTSADKVVLSVRNTSEPVEIVDGNIPTSKEDSRLHGYGLRNIRYILEQYHCPYTFHWKDGWFVFAAELPCHTQMETECASENEILGGTLRKEC